MGKNQKPLVLLIFLILSSSFSWAEEFICSGYIVLKKDLDSKLNKMKDVDKYNDLFLHCYGSCVMAIHCPKLDVTLFGTIKEISDVFTKGDASWLDLGADYIGASFGNSNMTEEKCFQRCDDLFPKDACSLPPSGRF